MSPTTFLVLGLLAAIATVVAALVHLSRVDDTIVGPAHSGSDAADTEPAAGQPALAAHPPKRRRTSTPLARRLSDDAVQLRRQRRLLLVSGTDDGDRRALELAQATGTARLARREHRLRALGRRRPLTAEEAAALTAACQVLTERGRLVPHEPAPRLTDRADQ